MSTNMLVLLFWAERGFCADNFDCKRKREEDSSEDANSFLERNELRSRSVRSGGCHARSKGASTSAAEPDASTWVNPRLGRRHWTR